MEQAGYIAIGLLLGIAVGGYGFFKVVHVGLHTSRSMRDQWVKIIFDKAGADEVQRWRRGEFYDAPRSQPGRNTHGENLRGLGALRRARLHRKSHRPHSHPGQSAGLEVEFSFEKEVLYQINKPTDPERPVVTNDRVAKVRRMVQESAAKFRLGTPVNKFFASFTDGDLRKFTVSEVE